MQRIFKVVRTGDSILSPRFTITPLALTLAAVGILASAQEHQHRQLGTHEHGVGQLNVALEREELHIELISPAMNIVGFEHAPKNPEQEQVVQRASKTLQDGSNVFSLPSAAQCQLAKAEVETDISGEDHHENEHRGEEHTHQDDAEHEEEVHSEFHVSYAFRCANPDALTHIDVNLFTLFSGTEELEAQLITEGGQTSANLTASSARIKR